MSDESWRRLDTLYRDIETDLGRPAAPLPKPDLRAAGPLATSGPATAATKTATAAKDRTAAAASGPNATQTAAASHAERPATSGIAPIWILLGVVFGAAFTAGIVVWNIRRERPTRTALPSLGPPDLVDLPGRPRKRAKSPATQPPAAKPPGTRPAAKGTGSSVADKPGGSLPAKKVGPKHP